MSGAHGVIGIHVTHNSLLLLPPGRKREEVKGGGVAGVLILFRLFYTLISLPPVSILFGFRGL
jgi:hypothetical protein